MNAALKPILAKPDAAEEGWINLVSSFEALRPPTTDLITLAGRSLQVPPVIIIGAGPAAQECARQLSNGLSDDDWLLMINGEHYLPYHRAQLSTALATGSSIDTLLTHEFGTNVALLHGVNIAVVETQSKKIFTDSGVEFSYRKLVLATGSQSRRPAIPGLHGSRVFDFRQLQDVERIAALAPQRVAVLGGGLLGIEAARALKGFCNEVTVFARGSHLLSRQVDAGAGERIARHLTATGIQVHVGARLMSVDTNYGQVVLHDEANASFNFDAIICATGISPNIGLAEHAQLQYHLGIEVDDEHLTSDPDIYAIGECSERRGETAGNLSASLEQARRAAASLLGRPLPPVARTNVFQLKMGSCVAVTIGDVTEREAPSLIYCPDASTYYRVFIHEQEVVGAILVGDIGLDFSAFTDAVERHLPWSGTLAKRFTKTGRLPDSGAIPPDTVVCFCTGTTYGKLSELRDAKHSHASITAQTGATLHCGSCAQRVAIITTNSSNATKTTQPRAQWTAMLSAMLLMISLLAAIAIPFAQHWQSRWRWIDVLWRDAIVKQVSGYVMLALMLLAFMPALLRRLQRGNKRPQSLSLMSLHLIAASALVAGFIVHTGIRWGHGINAALSITFAITLMIGALTSMTWRLTSRGNKHRTVAVNSRALHWMLLFPLPAIIAFHVLTVYYF